MLSALLTNLRRRFRPLRLVDRTATGSLEELHAHAPILPILARQLEEATGDMEMEVGGVCRSFHGMASRARASVQSAAGLLVEGNGERHDVVGVIQECRETMGNLLNRMERSQELSARTIQRMEQVQAGVRQVSKVLNQLDQAAFVNKIIALNARIQAVHLGASGKSFEVVAEEISVQADQSTRLTREVTTILEQLVGSAREAADDLGSMSASDQNWMGSSRQEILQTLTALEETNAEMRTSLHAASEESGALAREIEAALVNLQFQDRVSQRIHHVIDSLNAMHAAVDGAQTPTSESGVERRQEIAQKLTSSYTMKSERVVHGAVGGSDATEQEADVELF